MKPTISVLIPCCNGSNWIDRCFKSLTKQGIKDFDIIVVDDCSTDNSIELLNKWKTTFPNLKIIKNPSRRGAAYSRNVCLQHVKTDYFVFIDVDDTFAKNALLKLSKPIIENNKEFDVISGKCNSLYANKHNRFYLITSTKYYNHFYRNVYSSLDYFKHNFRSSVWAMLINKKYWDSLNIKFDESTAIEDVVPSFVFLFSAKTFCAIPKNISNYTVRSNSLFHLSFFSAKRLNDYKTQILNTFKEAEKRFSFNDEKFITALCSKLKYEIYTLKIISIKKAKENKERLKAINDFKNAIFNKYIIEKYDLVIKNKAWRKYFKSLKFKKTFKNQIKEFNFKF